MRLLSRVSLFLFLLSMAMVLPLHAQYYWTGNSSNDFSAGPSNWSPAAPYGPGNWTDPNIYAIGAGTVDPVLTNADAVSLFSVGNVTSGVGNLAISTNGVLTSCGGWVGVTTGTAYDGANGTLNIINTGSLVLLAGNNFHVGWGGTTGTLNMTDYTTLTQTGDWSMAGFMVGCNGGTGYMNMSYFSWPLSTTPTIGTDLSTTISRSAIRWAVQLVTAN